MVWILAGLWWLSFFVYVAYPWFDMVSNFYPTASAMKYELKPFYPYATVCLSILTTLLDSVIPGALIALFGAFFWWVTRNDDDDRWKRRRKKLAQKVSAMGGKLVVVPAHA
jgi:hypothetical protein